MDKAGSAGTGTFWLASYSPAEQRRLWRPAGRGVKNMPREFDLEIFVRSKMHLGLDELIGELVIEDKRQEKIARSSRSKATHTRRYEGKERLQDRHASARRNVERIGQLLWVPPQRHATIRRHGERFSLVQRTDRKILAKLKAKENRPAFRLDARGTSLQHRLGFALGNGSRRRMAAGRMRAHS
jgi:hypothetical protein